MQVGDKITFQFRTPILSKVLLRSKGYEYSQEFVVIQAIFKDSAIVMGDYPELISLKDLKLLKKTGRAWR